MLKIILTLVRKTLLRTTAIGVAAKTIAVGARNGSQLQIQEQGGIYSQGIGVGVGGGGNGWKITSEVR